MKTKPRSVWTGAITFGLVNVPVRMFTATSPHDIGFHQVDSKTKRRISYKRVAGDDGREVPYKDIVKGYELAKGKLVLIEPEELNAVEPKKTRALEIEQFVDLAEIDPMVWDQTYYLAPDDRAGADKTYALLRAALEETGKVGVGRFVMHAREYLATVRPLGRGLAVETMYYADELRNPDELGIPAKTSVSGREIALAKQLIDALAAPWKHAQFEDTYRDRVVDLIRKKSRGEEIAVEEPEKRPAEVIDLMEALKASLDARKSGPHRAPRGDGGRVTKLPERRPHARRVKKTRRTRAA